MVATTYFLIIFMTAIASAILTIYAWSRRNAFGGIPFLLIMLSGTFLVGFSVVTLLSSNRESAFVAHQIQNFGVDFASVHLLFFTLIYTHKVQRIRLGFIFVCYSIAMFDFVIIMTNHIHGWHYKAFNIIRINDFSFSVPIYNWWFYVHLFINSMFILPATIFLLVSLRHSQGVFRRQQLAILVAVLFPLLTSFITSFLRGIWGDTILLSHLFSISFVVSALIFTKTLISDQFLAISPIAHPLILTTLPEGIIIIDQYRRIIELNPIAREIKQLKEGEHIGDFVDVIFPELKSLSLGDIFTTQMPSQSQLTHLEYHPKPLYRKNQMIGTLIILRDVTRQKQAQQHELELALEKERVALLTKFIEKVSHEVRTPLSIIRNSAYLIHRIPDVDKRTENTEQIKSQVQRINRLVDMMLKLTHLENTKPAIATIHIHDFLADICADWQTKISTHRIVCESSASLPPIQADAHFLAEALNELIHNAIHFSPPNSTITLSASVQLEIMLIAVADEGKGIELEKIGGIFDKFWQGDFSQGLGLGLPFVKQIAHLHGGDVSVQSEMGKGSRFSIRLPIS